MNSAMKCTLFFLAAITHHVYGQVLVLNQQQPPQPEESVASDLFSTIQAGLSGLLNPFATLANPNLPCLGLTSLASGRCLSDDACNISGGSPDRGCLTGGHVCCIPTSKCGSVISAADAWISNDEYPNATSNGQSCVYTLNKASPLIAQLKIELDRVELATSPNCEQDKLVIDDVSGVNVFPICGLASGGHLIIPFSGNSLTLRIIVGDVPQAGKEAGVDANGNNVPKTPRKWRIRVTQFANNGPNVAPAGCTQLFSADGSIKSIGQGIDANGQKYAICFQKKPGMCGLKFDLSSLQPKGLLEQFLTAVEGSAKPNQAGMEHQQPMEHLPLQPQDVVDAQGQHKEKRQVFNPLGATLGLDTQINLLGGANPRPNEVIENILAANPNLSANRNQLNTLLAENPNLLANPAVLINLLAQNPNLLFNPHLLIDLLAAKTNVLLGRTAPPAPAPTPAPRQAHGGYQNDGHSVDKRQINPLGTTLGLETQINLLGSANPRQAEVVQNILGSNPNLSANNRNVLSNLLAQNPTLLANPNVLINLLTENANLLNNPNLLSNLVAEKLALLKPTPAPTPVPQPMHVHGGNSIYHQPAQHHGHHQPQVQPWQHAHQPAYGGHYGHHAPMPEPAPLPLPVKPVERVVEKPVIQQVNPNPTVTKSLTVETGLPGLLDVNNTLSLQVPKPLAQGVFGAVAPVVPLLETPKTPLVSNQPLPNGTITGIQFPNLLNPFQQNVVVETRNKREADGQEQDGKTADGQGDITKCTRTMFLAPTSTNNGGHMVCLEQGKYNGPTEVVIIGEPLVAFVEIAPSTASTDGSTSMTNEVSWNIPFSFVPC